MKVQVLTPNTPLADLEAEYVLVPGECGYLGIFPSHAPFLGRLGPGACEIRRKNESGISYFFVSDGFVEVKDDVVKVLVDVAEEHTKIDEERAKEAEQRAVQRLKDSADLDLDIPRALAALLRAQARLRLKRIQRK